MFGSRNVSMIKTTSHIKNILAACFMGCFFMWGCENDVNDVKELSRRAPGIEEGKNIESYISQSGRITAKLTAPLLLRYQGDSMRKAEFPNTLHVDFFDSTMKVESQLFAKYGRYLQNESKVFLRDSVIIFNTKGDTLYSNELFWDQSLGQFYTNTPVVLVQNYPYKQKGRYANGFRSNQDLTDITFFNIQPGSFAILPDSTLNQ
jgi:LPS export ABC transporter protein LptC